MTQESQAQVVADLVTGHITPQLVTVHRPEDENETAVLVLPAALKAHSIKPFLDEYRTAPERRRGTAKLGDLASLIALTKRFADADSVLFADPTPNSPSLTAVLDYHRAGASSEPRFGQHRAVYAFPVSDEWTAWISAAGDPMSQSDFAELIENRILDVADPSGAGDSAKSFATTLGCSFASPSKLLELSRGLAVRVSARAAKAVNLQSGETQIQYAEAHQDDAGQPLKVPGAFLLAIPVFRGGALYQVPARLRYRLSQGAISWSTDLYRTEVVFRHAFIEACDAAAKETGLPLLMGSPEA